MKKGKNMECVNKISRKWMNGLKVKQDLESDLIYHKIPNGAILRKDLWLNKIIIIIIDIIEYSYTFILYI